jgi:hypothetical protein
LAVQSADTWYSRKWRVIMHPILLRNKQNDDDEEHGARCRRRPPVSGEDCRAAVRGRHCTLDEGLKVREVG